ncbi:MAG: response regulator [Chloroflexi bacterium]|nr:response regulator [Chloroflexota bacterium]
MLALVVDDNIEIATLISFILRDIDVDSYQIYQGNEVLGWLEHNTPDVVFLDLQLPGMNGLDILRAMKEDARLMSIPVIVMTANSHMANAAEVDADLVLLKPVSMRQIQSLAQRALIT